MQSYITIDKECEYEFVEKKSKFKGMLFPVETYEQAQEKLTEIKKTYWDATHNCSAMIIGTDKSFMRYSDDGEPQGTAGVPMLEVLKQSGITNVLAVATRYFGGILLGAGGLVRAYTKSVSGAVANSQKIEMVPCARYETAVSYSAYGRMENLLANGGYIKEDALFAEDIKVITGVPFELEEKFKKDVTEAFLGAATPKKLDEVYVKKYL